MLAPTACVDALYAVQREWDMLRTWLGRNGINGSGRGGATCVAPPGVEGPFVG